MVKGGEVVWNTLRMRRIIAALLILAVLAACIRVPFTANALVFSSPAGLPNPDPYDNVFPKLLQLQNGSVWMVWEKVKPSLGGEIYLMQSNGYGWGSESVLVNGSYDDISPDIAQLSNGTIILVWSRGTSGNFNSYDIYTKSYTANKWTSPTPLVTNSPSNYDPVLAKVSDGSIWLVWSRSSSTNGNGDLYYKILRTGTWSNEAPIPTASNSVYEEKLPTIVQTANGKVWICYESNASGTAQLYCTTYSGTAWATPVQITTTSDTDKWPSIAQDRNGTMWIFWARELPNGTTPPPNSQPAYQWDIFYKSSSNNGTSWTVDNDLYANPSTQEQHPTVFQGPDKELWIVFDSCCNSPSNPYGNPNLFIAKSNVIPAHDLAVNSIRMSPGPRPRVGENVSFTVTVSDSGSYSESSSLSLYLDSNLIGTKSLTIASGSITTLVFAWNSTGALVGTHRVSAIVRPVPHEFATDDNRLNFTACVTYKGDVNRDGKVAIEDLTSIATHFAALSGRSDYFAPADLNADGKIDIIDLIICSLDFGKG